VKCPFCGREIVNIECPKCHNRWWTQSKAKYVSCSKCNTKFKRLPLEKS
jgi:ribosomal protein S27E